MIRVTLSLNFMHCMERFATQIYLTQRGSFNGSPVVAKLQAASDNEASHVARLKNRLRELKSPLIPLGWLFQFMGIMIGLITRLLGKRRLMSADIWVEKRAVTDYGGFLKKVPFDPDSSRLIENIIREEYDHIDSWTQIREGIIKSK